MTSILCFGLGFTLASGASLLAGDAGWPGFRGPNSSGLGVAARPPIEIGPTNLVLWTNELAWSPSSPAVAGGRVFVTTFADGKLETRAYATGDGRLLWSRPAPAERLEEYHPQAGSPATATPATDGGHVVSYFGSCGLLCYDTAGRELWHLRLAVAETDGSFGSGTSPLLVGDRVVLNRDLASGSSLMAVDLATGRKVWETQRPEAVTSYSTPILWRQGGREEVVVAGSVTMRAYDLGTGVEHWRVRGLPAATCTTPVLGDGLLFFAGWAPGKADSPFPTWEAMLKDQDKNEDGWLSADEVKGGAAGLKSFDFDKNGRLEKADWDLLGAVLARSENCLLAIRPGGEGDVTASHVAWKGTRGLPYVPSPLYYDGRVYLVKDGGMVSSFDARTGEPHYLQERLTHAEGQYYASPVAAEDRIYFASLKGVLTVIKAGGAAPEILHQADFQERIDATPALVGDRLYLRTKTKLHAYQRP